MLACAPAVLAPPAPDAATQDDALLARGLGARGSAFGIVFWLAAMASSHVQIIYGAAVEAFSLVAGCHAFTEIAPAMAALRTLAERSDGGGVVSMLAPEILDRIESFAMQACIVAALLQLDRLIEGRYHISQRPVRHSRAKRF